MKRKTTMSWDDWYNAIVLVDEPVHAYILKPTREVLVRAERALGHPFPQAYSDFILAFGAGELTVYGSGDEAAEFRCWSPFCEVRDYDLVHFNLQSRRHFELPPDNDPLAYADSALLKRMVFFATNFGSDLFGWDPDDITDPATHDCRVHFWSQGADRTSVIASTVHAFLQDLFYSDQCRVIRPRQPVNVEQRQFLPLPRR